MSKSYAWRPLALLPVPKGSVCTETDDDLLQHRRLELYHRSMDHIVQDIDELCSKDIYLRFADDKVRLRVQRLIMFWSWMVLRWLLHFHDCVM
jgi:hypothetical protein